MDWSYDSHTVSGGRHLWARLLLRDGGTDDGGDDQAVPGESL